jgi:1-acyl-sn-glycerol-3-phosphate acyltransferase
VPENKSKFRHLMSALRSYLFFLPLIFAYTGVVGTLSLISSLFDRSGRAQHRFARIWSRMILRTVCTSVKVEGLDALDPSQPHLYAANHLSAMDIPLLYGHLPFQFRIIAKQELFRLPFLGWHLRRSGQISIDPENALASMRSMNRAVSTLRGGMPLVVFPEGGRSPNGLVKPFLPGAFYVAIKAQADIVPLVLVGTFETLPMNTYHVHPRPLQLVAGAPISTRGRTLREIDSVAAQVQKAVEDMYYSRTAFPDPRGLAVEKISP